MSHHASPGPGQLELLTPAEIRPPELPPGFDLQRVVSISHMVRLISEQADLPTSYASLTELEYIEPANIQRGLYIPRDRAPSDRPKNLYSGVVFPAKQFLQVARSPRDLANHAFALTEKANDTKPEDERVLDRDILRAKSRRAAGHALEGKVEDLEVLRHELSGQRVSLLSLMRELRSPGRARYKAVNLDVIRTKSDEVIHQTVETAAVNMPEWNTIAVDGLHRAIRYHMYGHQGHNNTRLRYFRQYVLMAGQHTRAKLDAVNTSIGRAQHELDIYLPDLLAARD